MRLKLAVLDPDGQGLRIESQRTAEVKYPGDTPGPGPFVDSLRVEAEHLGGLFAGQRTADGLQQFKQAHVGKYPPEEWNSVFWHKKTDGCLSCGLTLKVKV